MPIKILGNGVNSISIKRGVGNVTGRSTNIPGSLNIFHKVGGNWVALGKQNIAPDIAGVIPVIQQQGEIYKLELEQTYGTPITINY